MPPASCKRVKTTQFFQYYGTLGNLGVTFDCTLSWDAHVSELCRRCTVLLIGLRVSHARHCLPDGIIRMLVTVLVVSRIHTAFQFMEIGLKI